MARNPFDAVVRDLGKALSPAVRATLLAIEAGAKVRAAVDTGAMRAGIHTVVEPDGLRGSVIAPLEYSVFVEFGTSAAPAQPFLTPAAEAQREPFKRRIAAALKGLG